MAVTLFVIDSFLYASNYHRYRVGRLCNRAVLKDPNLWGEVFNVLPSIGYLVTTIYQMTALLAMASSEQVTFYCPV